MLRKATIFLWLTRNNWNYWLERFKTKAGVGIAAAIQFFSRQQCLEPKIWWLSLHMQKHRDCRWVDWSRSKCQHIIVSSDHNSSVLIKGDGNDWWLIDVQLGIFSDLRFLYMSQWTWILIWQCQFGDLRLLRQTVVCQVLRNSNDIDIIGLFFNRPQNLLLIESRMCYTMRTQTQTKR